ncbi:MAG: hypothetical protein ACKPBH_20225 [Dolichospermum sp.]
MMNIEYYTVGNIIYSVKSYEPEEEPEKEEEETNCPDLEEWDIPF